MKAIEILHRIKQFDQPVLHTHEVAAILNVSRAHASQLLRRLSLSSSIVSLKRGLWLIDKNFNPYQLITYLVAPFPAYLSLQSALYFHEMISQIPEIIYVVSIARTHRLYTAVGDYSFHHVHPEFFVGFSISQESHISIATPEKALVDFLYLSPAKSKLFHSLPELSLPNTFDIKLAYDYISHIPSQRTKSLVAKKFETFLNRV